MTSLAQRTRHAWPGDARCVVGLTLDFDGTSLERGRNQLPYGARSHGRYSAKCGIPRFVDMFARQQVPWTFYVSGYDAEEQPGPRARPSRAPGSRSARTAICTRASIPAMPSPSLLERRTSC